MKAPTPKKNDGQTSVTEGKGALPRETRPMNKAAQVDQDLVRTIAELVNQQNLAEIEVEIEGLRVRVTRSYASAPAPMQVYAPAPQAAPAYAAPAPHAPVASAPATETLSFPCLRRSRTRDAPKSEMRSSVTVVPVPSFGIAATKASQTAFALAESSQLSTDDVACPRSNPASERPTPFKTIALGPVVRFT